MANKNWNDWKFQIQIVNNTRIHIVCLLKSDNNKTTHWVRHSKLKPLDTDDFFKRKTN